MTRSAAGGVERDDTQGRFGLEEYTMPDGTVVVGHSGSTAGYATMMFRLSARDTTLVTAVNTSDLFVNALNVFIPAIEAINAEAR